jgi:hypothetical protein
MCDARLVVSLLISSWTDLLTSGAIASDTQLVDYEDDSSSSGPTVATTNNNSATTTTASTSAGASPLRRDQDEGRRCVSS